MTERSVLALLIAASAAALALAFVVQYGLGYPPCSLCERARLPHYALVLTGGLALGLGRPRLGLFAALAALLAAVAISLTHVGVEAGWLPPLAGCEADPSATSIDELRASLLAQTRPSCAQPGPTVLGFSMAAWHAVAAIALAVTAALGLSREDRETASSRRADAPRR